MTDLSPAAQSVLDAMYGINMDFNGENSALAAAALRAAADQVVPLTPKPDDTVCCPPVSTIAWSSLVDKRQQLLALAAELENANV